MGQGSIIGYEINEKTCQISFYNEKDLEPDTLEVDTDNYQIPLIIGKLRDTWAYGKEAKRLVTIKDGFTATRLLSKSLAGDKIEFGEETYDAVWLLSQFIQMSLQSFPEIDGIVFTVPSLSSISDKRGVHPCWHYLVQGILINVIFLSRITRRVFAITCFISRRNCGSMTQRCFAVTEMRSKRICLGGFGRGWEAEKRRLLQ